MAEDICYHDEDTLFKAAKALRETLGYEDKQIIDIFSVLGTARILIREPLPYVKEEPNEDPIIRTQAPGSGSDPGK